MKNWLMKNKKSIQWTVVVLNAAMAAVYYWQGNGTLAVVWTVLAVSFFMDAIDE